MVQQSVLDEVVVAAQRGATRPPPGAQYEDAIAEIAFQAMKDNMTFDEASPWERRICQWAGVTLPTIEELANEATGEFEHAQQQRDDEIDKVVREAELTALAATKTIFRKAEGPGETPDGRYKSVDRWLLQGTGFHVGRFEQVERRDGAVAYAQVESITHGAVQLAETTGKRKPRFGDELRLLSGEVITVPDGADYAIRPTR